MLELERYAEISAQKLVDAIAVAKTPELPRFIYGLGIRHVGTQIAADLAEAYGSLEKLSQTTLDELLEVDGIGEVCGQNPSWPGLPTQTTKNC